MEFSSKNIEAGCRFLLQEIFPTCRSKLSLLSLQHWQVDFLPLAPPGTPSFWLLFILAAVYWLMLWKCLLQPMTHLTLYGAFWMQKFLFQ